MEDHSVNYKFYYLILEKRVQKIENTKKFRSVKKRDQLSEVLVWSIIFFEKILLGTTNLKNRKLNTLRKL